jgi:rhamnulokinase
MTRGSPDRRYAAVDLGAESGRVIVGRIDGGRVTLEPVHRFANLPVRLPDGLHWNVAELFAQTLTGLGRAAAGGGLAGIGIDAWGVDYALLDRSGRMLGLPFHHRDGRTERMVARLHERVGASELYEVTGIQTIQINTIFQLLADQLSSASSLALADRIALIGDLTAYWLTGTIVNEVTAASTTGLLDARTGRWAQDLVSRLGYPRRPFEAEPVEPGAMIGPVLERHADTAGDAAGVPVRAAAGHDTASAFVGAPVEGPGAAILSSGTWSLLGVELDEPVLTPEARTFNLSNERGVDGKTRLLANVMGLWIVQECRRAWQRDGRDHEYGQLLELAEAAGPHQPLFDPDAPRFLPPGDMPGRIADACRESGQSSPESPGGFVRSALTSIACKYRLVLERLERATGRDVEVVYVIGGGSQNALLCRLTAAILGRPVVAGPVEATTLGNVLVQARAAGELGSLEDLRRVVRASIEPRVYEPGEEQTRGEDDYGRFLTVTRLSSGPRERAAV